MAEMLPGFDPDPPEQPEETLELCVVVFLVIHFFLDGLCKQNKEPSVLDDDENFFALFLPVRGRCLAMMTLTSRLLMKLKWKMPFGPCRDEGPRSTVPPSVPVGALWLFAREAHLQDFCCPLGAQPHPPLSSTRLGAQRCPCWTPSHRPAVHPAPRNSLLARTVCLRPLTSTLFLQSSARRSTLFLKIMGITYSTRTRPYLVLSVALVTSRSRLRLPTSPHLLWRKRLNPPQEAERKQSFSAAFRFYAGTESASAHLVPSPAGANDTKTRITSARVVPPPQMTQVCWMVITRRSVMSVLTPRFSFPAPNLSRRRPLSASPRL